MGPTRLLIDRVVRRIFGNRCLRPDFAGHSVEDVDIAGEIGSNDGMCEITVQILHHHHTQLVGTKAHLPQGHIFRDRIVLAVP